MTYTLKEAKDLYTRLGMNLRDWKGSEEDYMQIGIMMGDLIAEVERLRAAILAVEWVSDRDADFCPWCQISNEWGTPPHKPDCPVLLALGEK